MTQERSAKIGEPALRDLRADDRRRGPFRVGERVQLTDVKGRKYTVNLTDKGFFQSTRGNFRHSELIGKPEGTVIETEDGHRLLALRPLVSDFVLSMPRGATVIYPKDAGQIIHGADIFPGARVFEAGLGSGALALSLLAAVGERGRLISADVRPEFIEIAVGNVVSWYGEHPTQWTVREGDAAAVLADLEAQYLDAVVLDMLAPWEIVGSAAHALREGGVICVYVATVTQLSRVVEELRDSESFTEPIATESMVRSWHVDGLAVRPDHSMVGHTGFLVMARRLALGSQQLKPTKRPAPAAEGEAAQWSDARFEGTLAEREISQKKLRKVRRDVAHRADVEASGTSGPGAHSAEIRQRLQAESEAKVRARLEANND